MLHFAVNVILKIKLTPNFKELPAGSLQADISSIIQGLQMEPMTTDHKHYETTRRQLQGILYS